MPRPKTLVTGRSTPIGPSQATSIRAATLRIHRGIPGLTFTRVRGVRRLKGFAAAPRGVIELPEVKQFFEDKFAIWERVFGGTRPEYVVFNWLEKKAGMIYGVDFLYQSSKNGGRQQIGGSVADFEIPKLRLILRVQGERFHLTSRAIQNDLIQKVILTGEGFTVVDIWPHQLDQATNFVMEKALQGVSLQEPRQN